MKHTEKMTPILTQTESRRWVCVSDVGIDPLIRKKALQRTYCRCIYCGNRGLSVDHYVPVSRGGSHNLDNLFACCKSCNSGKGCRLLHEARHVMAVGILGWPAFKAADMEWMRERGWDLTEYDNFRFLASPSVRMLGPLQEQQC